jgi:PEP-CTERM/exosortase A-associated glycosyltransferase
MTPLRILHILDHSLPLHSGYTFRSRSILQAQAKRGWQPAVLTSPKHQESWKGKWELEETLEDVPHFRTPLTASSRVPGYYETRLISALSQRIYEVASTYKPDVIHAHSPVLNAMAALRAGRRLQIPVAYEIRAFWEDAAVDHGTYVAGSLKYRIVRALETRACKKAAQLIVICEGLGGDLVGRGIPAEKISVVRNGINLEEFKESRKDEEITQRYCLNQKKVIGFLGSFYRYEGLDLLIEAFALAAKTNNDFNLLLAGGGEMERELKEKVDRLGLQKLVHFPGRLAHERMPGIYAAVDVLAYPRYSMRLTELVTPLKPLEAMAMGKAVIASDVGGHKELIRNGETGILFPAGNASALASCLGKVLTNQELRQGLVERGREYVQKTHPWEKTTAIYETVYSKALAQFGRAV